MWNCFLTFTLSLFLLYRSAAGVCVSRLYPANKSLNLFFGSNSFCMCFAVFSVYVIMLPANCSFLRGFVGALHQTEEVL